MGTTELTGTGFDTWHSSVGPAGATRWLETQAPQLPSNYSYRFNRDWDYLAEQIGGKG